MMGNNVYCAQYLLSPTLQIIPQCEFKRKSPFHFAIEQKN